MTYTKEQNSKKVDVTADGPGGTTSKTLSSIGTTKTFTGPPYSDGDEVTMTVTAINGDRKTVVITKECTLSATHP